MTEQHPEHDDLVALALRDLGPEQSAAISGHLVSCGACRAAYALVDLDVQQALAATPAIAPPAGFSGRVLDRMSQPDPGLPATVPRARHRWRTPLLVAAAMMLGLLLGVGGTVAMLSRAPVPGVPAQVAHAPLLTSQGQAVGSVGLISLDGRDQLVVSVTAGRIGVSYECVIVGRDGQRRSAGSYTMHDPAGTWVVPAPASGIERVELVGASGKVWSSAGF